MTRKFSKFLDCEMLKIRGEKMNAMRKPDGVWKCGKHEFNSQRIEYIDNKVHNI